MWAEYWNWDASREKKKAKSENLIWRTWQVHLCTSWWWLVFTLWSIVHAQFMLIASHNIVRTLWVSRSPSGRGVVWVTESQTWLIERQKNVRIIYLARWSTLVLCYIFAGGTRLLEQPSKLNHRSAWDVEKLARYHCEAILHLFFPSSHKADGDWWSGLVVALLISWSFSANRLWSFRLLLNWDKNQKFDISMESPSLPRCLSTSLIDSSATTMNGSAMFKVIGQFFG